MEDKNSITAITSDPNTKMIAASNCNGFLVLFSTETGKSLLAVKNVPPKYEMPIVGLTTLFRGENLILVSMINGMVMMFDFMGNLVAEV
jgi:hypothetical protein